jgi:cytochrome c oxidase subunit IV
MHEHDETGHHPQEHQHPGAKEYVGIAVVLTAITAVEVAVFYIPTMKPMLVPTLLVLSALKFALVAMFYMHLKFDDRLFSWLFVVPMIVVALLIIALLRLFGHW